MAKEKKVISRTELALNFHNLYTYIKTKFKVDYHESRISIKFICEKNKTNKIILPMNYSSDTITELKSYIKEDQLKKI